jgi:hypothetical protein
MIFLRKTSLMKYCKNRRSSNGSFIDFGIQKSVNGVVFPHFHQPSLHELQHFIMEAVSTKGQNVFGQTQAEVDYH